jgi:hypothetical protein
MQGISRVLKLQVYQSALIQRFFPLLTAMAWTFTFSRDRLLLTGHTPTGLLLQWRNSRLSVGGVEGLDR